MCVLRGLALEGVGANQFTQIARLVSLRTAHRTHLDEADFMTGGSESERGLTASQPAPDDGDDPLHFFFRDRPFLLPPPFAALSASIVTAVSRSISSGSVPFARVTFNEPSVTYAP